MLTTREKDTEKNRETERQKEMGDGAERRRSVQPGGAPRSLCWRGPVLKLRSTSGVAALDNGDSSSSSSSQIEFYAARAISEGEELTFDYGVAYWVARDVDPLPGSDSRQRSIRVKRALRWLGPALTALRSGLPL